MHILRFYSGTNKLQRVIIRRQQQTSSAEPKNNLYPPRARSIGTRRWLEQRSGPDIANPKSFISSERIDVLQKRATLASAADRRLIGN